MKLQNKETKEIGSLIHAVESDKYVVVSDDLEILGEYKTLKELAEKWEDVPEDDDFWFFDEEGIIRKTKDENWPAESVAAAKEIGDYFSSEAEAEKAVEKLKAWKRLKDKGFEFSGWTIDDGLRISICTNTDEDDIYDEDRRRIKPDLDLLFGGEE